MILAVGYRVKSPNGIVFRKWATSILKDYMIKGYAINEKRLKALNRVIEIQSRIIAQNYISMKKQYYDHQCVNKPNGIELIHHLTYDECRKLIDSMRFESDVFGLEREKGKLEGILSTIYQNVFGVELYPSIEEKAANLLYFLIKDHPFADGCKRIGATIFLEFLNKNNHLIKDGIQIISNSALVAITLLVAESKPEEKGIIVNSIMNFLNINTENEII